MWGEEGREDGRVAEAVDNDDGCGLLANGGYADHSRSGHGLRVYTWSLDEAMAGENKSWFLYFNCRSVGLS